jgi:hypothetical protein
LLSLGSLDINNDALISYLIDPPLFSLTIFWTQKLYQQYYHNEQWSTTEKLENINGIFHLCLGKMSIGIFIANGKLLLENISLEILVPLAI